MNLTSVSRIDSNSEYAPGALATLLENSPILRNFDFNNAFERDATNFDFTPVDNSSNFGARAIGGGYTAQAVEPTVTPVSVALKIYGDQVIIDNSYKADEEFGLRKVDEILRKKIARRLRDFAIKLDNALMNGTGSSNTVKGFSKILNGTDDLPGYTGVKGVKNAADYDSGVSFDLSSTSKYAKFLEAMNDILAQVPNATAIWCNRDFISRIQTVAYKERGVIDTLEQYGRRILAFRGIPLIEMNTGVITSTEPDDTPTTPLTNTTSIYVVRPREMDLSLVTNSGLEFIDYDPTAAGKQSQGFFWEFRVAPKIEVQDSILRVRNIKL